MGAAVIEGPKACGKTVTAQHAAASEVRLDIDLKAREAAALEPAFVLDGPTPRLIDEWQLEPRSGTTCGVRSTTVASPASSSSPARPSLRTTSLATLERGV